MGIETYVGSSKRIFPIKPLKPIEVLNSIEDKVAQNKVKIETNSELLGFVKQKSKFLISIKKEDATVGIEFDYIVFAFGGSSWKVTGSTGDWLTHFEKINIKTIPFQPSNCALKVDWNHELIKKIAGQPLKNISVTSGNKKILGEVMLTEFGIEGTPTYTLSNQFRNSSNQINKNLIHLDFKPNSTKETLLHKIQQNRKVSWSEHLKLQLKITKTQLALIKSKTNKTEFQSAEFIVDLVKCFPIEISGLASLDEAISTVGGIALSEVSENFELINYKNTFVLGEMLDWDAPTGGYLIQGCMSMGQLTANYFNQLM